MVVVRAVGPYPRECGLLDTDSRLSCKTGRRKDQDLFDFRVHYFSRTGSRKKITYTDTGYRGSKTQ
jgi:hypothetical protein